LWKLNMNNLKINVKNPKKGECNYEYR